MWIMTEYRETECGVRQHYILSPYPFNLYAECIIQKAGFDANEGAKFCERNIDNVKYADDTILLAESNNDLK